MALITCRECGASVSSKAKTCPNSGARKKAMTGRIGVFGWIWRSFLGLFVLSFALGRC